MKRNALFFLLLLLLQVSCQTEREEDPRPASAELIAGEWVVEDLKLRYFNAAGAQVHEQVLPGGGGNVYTFQDPSLTVTYTDGSKEEGSYEMFTVGGQDFVEISIGGFTNRHEIVTLTADRLVWQQDYPSRTLYDGNQVQTADRALTVEEFRRR